MRAIRAQVYKGMYREQPVAVKVCRSANMNASAMKQFQKEVGILQHCTHSNIVAFIGACTWKACPSHSSVFSWLRWLLQLSDVKSSQYFMYTGRAS